MSLYISPIQKEEVFTEVNERGTHINIAALDILRLFPRRI